MKALLLEAEFKPRPGYRLTERERMTKRANDGTQVFWNPGLRMIDMAVPAPAPGQVLVKVKSTGVCGSDVHFIQKDDEGYTLFPGHCKFPTVIGHEWSGQVVALGDGVTSLKVGDPVCVEEMNWCGECTPCRAGLVNQCKNLEEIGVTYQGAFAEYVACGARYCWKIDSLLETYGESDGYDSGAMVEPCSVAYNAMFIGGEGFQVGANVLVAGAGPIGLLATALARAAGAAKVIVMEPAAARREMAKVMGADVTLDPVQLEKDGIRPADVIMEQTRGDGVKMAVEAAGASTRTYPVILEVLSADGKIVQVGQNPNPVVPVPMVRMHYQMLSLHASCGHSGRDVFGSVVRLMAAKRVNVLPMITARLPLDQALEAVNKAAALGDAKVMVKQ